MALDRRPPQCCWVLEVVLAVAAAVGNRSKAVAAVDDVSGDGYTSELGVEKIRPALMLLMGRRRCNDFEFSRSL